MIRFIGRLLDGSRRLGTMVFNIASTNLLIVPILVIYRKYYGKAVLVRLVAVFYFASVLAGYGIEIIFGLLGLITAGERNAETGQTTMTSTTPRYSTSFSGLSPCCWLSGSSGPAAAPCCR